MLICPPRTITWKCGVSFNNFTPKTDELHTGRKTEQLRMRILGLLYLITIHTFALLLNNYPYTEFISKETYSFSASMNDIKYW